MCALAWLRPCITEIDLAASLMPPDCVATLIKLLPKRVKTLSLSTRTLQSAARIYRA